MKASEMLQEDDLAWLIRFRETAEDDNSYDTPKDALKRLIELGVVRSLGFGRCATTAFGDWLIEQHFEQAPKLPLKPEADYRQDHRYGPDNPPRLRKPGESLEDYRTAMGWGNKTPNASLSGLPLKEE